MAIQLFGDPFNLQGSNSPIQGGNTTDILQPATAPVQVAGPVSPKATSPVKTITPTPVKKVAPITSTPVATKSSVYFYKPDPNSQQVYDANGTPLSYDQYIAAGGLSDFSNVLNQQIPNQTLSKPVVTATPVTSSPTLDPNQALAQAAGKAGLGLDDFIKLLSSSNRVSADEENQIRKNLGIDTLEQQVFSAPSKTTEQLYTEAYSSAGLADLKAKIADLDNQIADKKQQFTDAQGTINENPFLSEATRVGRIKRLNDQAEATISNLIEQQNQYTNLYNSGLNEVHDLVTRYTTDFNTSQDFNQKKLNYLEQKAQEQIQQKQSTNSGTNLSSLTAYLQAKAKAAKPDTIGSPETGYFKYDPDTGKFVQVTEATGPKATGIVAEYQYYADQERAAGRTPVDFNSYQTMDANRKRSVTNVYAGGLSPNQINTTVNQIAGAFDNEPIVKNYNIATEGYQTLKTIGTNSSNPADDQAFIYAFAKLMDPSSAVKEGEYNTIQRYAQSWAQTYGFKAERIFSNTNFLSTKAKENMLSTIEAKYKTIKSQYNNVSNEYQRQIDDAYSGKPRQITNYGDAFDSSSNNTSDDPLDLGL